VNGPTSPAPRRVAIWSYVLRDDLVDSLRAEGIEVVALFQGSSSSVPSYSLHELFYGSDRIDRTRELHSPTLATASFLRIYGNCICRLSFIPHALEPWFSELGVVSADNLEDWASLHRRHFAEILRTHQVQEVWFFGAPHLGLDNALEFEARTVGLTTLVFRQAPIAGKFFYSREQAQTIVPSTIAFTPYANGGKSPNLFYMRGVAPAPRTGWAQLIERLRFALRVVVGRERARAWSRLYEGLARRGCDLALLLLDFSAMETREVAFRRYIRRARFQRDKRNRKMFRGDLNSERYVYFPLHHEPEANTAVLGRDFSNQVNAIEALSAVLPVGWKILLKENPIQNYMFRDTPFYERLRYMPDVFFVEDDSDSSCLIQRSAVVATITGTAGFEALLNEKACVYFGDAWYQGFPGACAFDHELDLAAIAAVSIDRGHLDVAVNSRISAAADGLVYARMSGLYTAPIAWEELARVTANSLARISRHFACAEAAAAQ
jgi:hypothetical protein